MVLRAGLVAPPEVVVEDAHQLLGSGEGDDLAAVFETAMANELMKDPGLETLNDVGEIGCVQDAAEKMARPSCVDGSVGHRQTIPRGANYHGSFCCK